MLYRYCSIGVGVSCIGLFPFLLIYFNATRLLRKAILVIINDHVGFCSSNEPQWCDPSIVYRQLQGFSLARIHAVLGWLVREQYLLQSEAGYALTTSGHWATSEIERPDFAALWRVEPFRRRSHARVIRAHS